MGGVAEQCLSERSLTSQIQVGEWQRSGLQCLSERSVTSQTQVGEWQRSGLE